MKFYDYIFYRCYCYYLKKDKDGIPFFWSVVMTSAGQMMNILGFFILLGILMDIEILNKLNILLIIAFLIGANFIRYKYYVSFDFLYDKWRNETKRQKLKNGWIIAAYFLLSLVFDVGILPLLKALL